VQLGRLFLRPPGELVGRQRPRLFERIARGALGWVEADRAEKLLHPRSSLAVQRLRLFRESADRFAVGSRGIGDGERLQILSFET
jgi:hypothetical protein